MVLQIENLSFGYDTTKPLFKNFNLCIKGPERIALLGNNGSGKTTLIKLILGQLKPQSGSINLGIKHVGYLDQHASLLDPNISILDNFKLFNLGITTNGAHAALAQFLFRNVTASKLVKDLSGGEKLRALLACSLLAKNPPQLLILDEPTNHLDLDSVASIESALHNYRGALLVISHDEQFIKNIALTNKITLCPRG